MSPARTRAASASRAASPSTTATCSRRSPTSPAGSTWSSATRRTSIPADRESLAPEVRDHEPALALFPPRDPLSLYRSLARASASSLRPGGWLVVELGQGQASSVQAACPDEGLVPTRLDHDLAGIPRCLTARRA